MKSDKKNISQDSLENLLIILMNFKDEDGLLLNINPANAFQGWLIDMYPESMRQHWFNLHTYVKEQENKGTREMNDEPVAWAVWEGNPHDVFLYKEEADELCRLKGGDAKSVPLYTHPAKELHLSLQKNKETGELLAVTYTDDEHRIVEVLWQKPPAKTLTDEEIMVLYEEYIETQYASESNVLGFGRAILRKAQEK